MSTSKPYRAKHYDVEAMPFRTIDDYLAIVAWMKECGDTYALAGEVTYNTPEMALQTSGGRMSARPGDWIVRYDDGFCVITGHVFAAAYEPNWAAD